MEILNFGKINNRMATKLAKTETQKDVLDYINVIKESKTLQKEFSIYSNLENEKFTNEALAIKFIDDNRRIIDFNESDYLSENKKISRFNTDKEINKDTEALYDAVDMLIREEISTIPNPKKITSCYNIILENLLRPEEAIEESSLNTNIDFTDLLDESIKIFNNKYSNLNENERKIMNILIYSNQERKVELFESCKNEVVGMLNDYTEETPAMKSKIQETLNKTNSLEYSEDNMIEIYRLYESLF